MVRLTIIRIGVLGKNHAPKEGQIFLRTGANICPIKSRRWHDVARNRLLDVIRRKVRCIHNRTKSRHKWRLNLTEGIPMDAVEEPVIFDVVDLVSLLRRGKQTTKCGFKPILVERCMICLPPH